MKRTLIIVALIVALTMIAGAQDAGYQLLDVDGIRVRIDEIRFARNYGDSVTAGSIDVGQTVNLTGALGDVFSGGIALWLEAGEQYLSYDHININMSGGVGILGHTYLETADTHVYTSTGGVRKLIGAGATWVPPADYDYLANDYIYYPGDEGEQIETTFLESEVTYDPADGLDISLLVDTFQVAYYWDGQESSRHGFVESWHWEDPSYFPAGDEVIGITYLPLYVAVNNDLDSETYVVAVDEADLTPTDYYDQLRTMTMTLTFDQVGAFFLGRTANWDGLDVSLFMPQFVIGAESNAGVYDLTLENYDDGWTSPSTLSSFTRIAIDSTATAELTDAYGSTQTVWYKRVK